MQRTLQVVPRYDDEAKRLLIGFGFGTRGVDVGVGEAAKLSVTGMWDVTTTTVSSIVKLVYDPKARDEVSGVVGSYEATRQSFEFDTVRAVSILALISLSLGIINLFPFLPLDGGHIFWALAEKVRGRAISLRVMERASVGRLRARPAAVLRRVVQRHRTIDERRGLRRPIAPRAHRAGHSLSRSKPARDSRRHGMRRRWVLAVR